MNEPKENLNKPSLAQLSRRQFLSTLGVSAAVVAGASISGCAPNDRNTSSENVLEEGSYSWESAPPLISESEIVDTLEADVVIIGAGMSGSTAALSAAEDGASVIVLQKNEEPMSHGFCAGAYDAEFQRAAGSEFDLVAWRDLFCGLAGGYGDVRYIESMVFNSGRAFDMINKHASAKGEDFGVFVSPPGSVACLWVSPDIDTPSIRIPDVVRKLQVLNEELGVQYHFNTAGEYLEKENDCVVAVIANGPDGYIRAKAKKGVILSTGDIGNNTQMVAKYAPFALGLTNVYAPATNTGDGHRMAIWAGARIHPGPFSMMIHYDPSALPGGDAPFSGSPYLAVNARGERYQNEDQAEYSALADANVQQPQQLRWQIIDKTFVEYWDNFGEDAFRQQGFEFATNEEAVNAALDNGSILKASTLEELADNIGFEGSARETLFATIERYNALVDQGYDEDFGKNPEYLQYTAIKEAPFYSIMRQPMLLTLPDGIFTSSQMEALDEDLVPIPGLYCTGNVSHGMFGPDYPVYPPGFSLARAASSGMVAGKAILDKMPEYKSYAKPLSGEGIEVSPTHYVL